MFESFLAAGDWEGTLLWALTSVSIFIISILLAAIFNKLIYPVILRFTNWTPTDLDARLVRASASL